MRAVIQRVREASVAVEGRVVGEIGRGLLVFVGIEGEDAEEDGAWLANKLAGLRVFEDEAGQMKRSLAETGGGILLISQFTLYGNLRKGTRPSFNRAAPAEFAREFYGKFHRALEAALGKPVPTGVFGAMMEIWAAHDGPVTLMLDTKQRDF